MSSTVASESAAGKPIGLTWSIRIRAAIVIAAWLPFLVLVSFFIPKFESLFSRLQERGELPAVTELLMWFALLNKALLFLPCLLFLGLLVLADLGVAKLLQRSRREWQYVLYFVGVLVAGVVAPLIVVTALLLPVMVNGR